ncbi:MAG: hypothetical protein LC776_13685 [Acidobacteria bacterium]|nr:hypothetical protein [Acidobacteriota bacterium]
MRIGWRLDRRYWEWRSLLPSVFETAANLLDHVLSRVPVHRRVRNASARPRLPGMTEGFA